ncbi:MAG: 4-hydroxy-3-methylbut-2-enyl diphosphate reductase [Bacteroidetes bacterium]|nr:4-hydroxy-3-methylbut-2-enyl diphosphate reductase [Bacteroidota bacterium]
MKVTIDNESGFCFGVVYAIQLAEQELDKTGTLYCLGDIVHNNMEVERLTRKGLKIIDHTQLQDLKDCKVLLRAHGEPPSTYETAIKNNIELIDASCPVVLKLQYRVRDGFEEMEQNNGQIVIYGEENHAEVNGLIGQTEGKAILVRNEDDLDKVDFRLPIQFFSQTTKSTAGFEHMKAKIGERILEVNGIITQDNFTSNDTLCRQVSNREPRLRKFAKQYDVIIFVSGKKSSNGKVLYNVCKEENPRSYFISTIEDLDYALFDNANTVGICGATSTPMWLMEEIEKAISANFSATTT